MSKDLKTKTMGIRFTEKDYKKIVRNAKAYFKKNNQEYQLAIYVRLVLTGAISI